MDKSALDILGVIVAAFMILIPMAAGATHSSDAMTTQQARS